MLGNERLGKLSPHTTSAREKDGSAGETVVAPGRGDWLESLLLGLGQRGMVALLGFTDGGWDVGWGRIG